MAWSEVDGGVTENSSTTVNTFDDKFTLKDNLDSTKALQFQLSGITTATTRTLTVPDANTTIVGHDAAQVLTNKTISLGSNTVSGTTAQFNTALSDGDFATLAGSEVLTNKTLTTPTIGSFVNATHTHANAAGGGQMTVAALSDHTTWTTPAFDAANFTGNNSMTWTVASGDVTTYAYTITGKVMTVAWQIITSTVGGTPSTALQIKIPASKTATKAILNACMLNDNLAGLTHGYALVPAGGTVIQIFKISGNWTASTDQTFVYGQITFEIN